MPELVEQMYCSQQIIIPPKFPYILKRYCKAAIKTQPYDLLRWSFEYFRALSLRRPPPVKLRLEYPVYSTEGGLTRGCLKVLANQLAGMSEVPLPVLRAAWQGFCLDQEEMRRVLCLCEVYLRQEMVPFLHFIAVAGGLLTTSLTNTMILLCETLTKEPDGGSANIPLNDFLTMYNFLARIDASKDVKYFNGYREGHVPEPETVEEEQDTLPTTQSRSDITHDDFWDIGDDAELMKLTVINDSVARSARLSVKLNMPLLGKISRSPSVERAAQIERENYMRERRGKPMQSQEVESKLRQMSLTKVNTQDKLKDMAKPQPEKPTKNIFANIHVIIYDPDDNELPIELYGEPKTEIDAMDDDGPYDEYGNIVTTISKPEEDMVVSEKAKIATFVSILYQEREDRREDMNETLDEIALIVDRYLSANYDLGMVAGRQMSTTSGEFIVQSIEKEILAYIDDQIAILPDPDLKKKKAKPEEVAMVRDLLEEFLDKNMDIIVKEIEEIAEEEEPIPEVTVVYAVPGIGRPVDEEIVADFVEYANEVSTDQSDVFMPRNIRHFMCPPLEKFVDYKYDEDTNNADESSKTMKEEVATSGVITD